MPITLPRHCSGCMSTRDKRPGPGWSWNSVVKCLLSKHEALSSTSTTEQKQSSPPSSCLYYILYYLLCMYGWIYTHVCPMAYPCSEGNSLTMILYFHQVFPKGKT